MAIVPHPDDELNIVGQMIPLLQNMNTELFVVYTTNGDHTKELDNKRIEEALQANEVLGISRDHVIFLGYPNEWGDCSHLYNTSGMDEHISKLGKRVTNSIKDHSEFIYAEKNIHHSFSRNNYRDDLKNVIEKYLADLIIVVDYDGHIDHRATSLLFDEVMGTILKEVSGYHPVVLKKFAYSGVWKGEKDYYKRNNYTCNTIKSPFGEDRNQTESPFFFWDERIRFQADKNTYTVPLRKNILYKAALKHKTQIAWYQMQRVLNADIVYWKRNTDNLALKATVKASSGNSHCLNDFKLYDSNDERLDILSVPAGFYSWIPESSDPKKTITFDLENKTTVKQINIYVPYWKGEQLKKIRIIFNESQAYTVNDLDDKGRGIYTLIFENGIVAKNVGIQLLDFQGCGAITEVEIFDHLLEHKSIYERTGIAEFSNGEGIHFNTGLQIEKLILNVKLLFTYKIKEKLKNIIRKSER